ncbi:hypothetical protein [Aeoliella sp. SH292]|uniref:hypothetical protein n=1 Tax=Aeoliella sp. SH292 TaxID=3454464 RepID=UPI003F9819EA
MLRSHYCPLASLSLIAVLGLASTGCERKEKVVDIETPAGEVEVLRDVDNGDVEVDVSENP